MTIRRHLAHLLAALLSRILGCRIVVYRDQRAYEHQLRDLKHVELARELGRTWKDR